MAPPRIVDECLGSVDATSEEGRRAHPCRGKLDTVLRRDYHAESAVGTPDLYRVRAAVELKRVIGGLCWQLVLFRVVTEGEGCGPNRYHDVLIDEVGVGHACDFLDDAS